MLALTVEDKALITELNGRDPLGIMAVWQHRARDLVPSLSAASNRAEGFQILLTALAWWPEFATQHHRRANELPQYFLLVEQAFARATRFAGLDGNPGWRLPGSRRLNAGRDGLWIGKKPNHQLLTSPLNNGTWGIYRGPARASGLVDDQHRVEPEIARDLVGRTGVMRKLFPKLVEAMSSETDEVIDLAHRRDNQVVSGLVSILAELPSRPYLRARLIEPRSSPITGDLAKLAARRGDDFQRDQFLFAAARRLPPHAAVLMRIVHCERLLASLEQAFEFACAAETYGTLDALARALPIDMAALRQAREDFRNSGTYVGLSDQRAKELCALDLGSKSSLLLGLLDLHAEVSKNRGSAPWMTLSSGARLERAIALPLPAQTSIDPGTAWRNDYYLYALASLARQLKDDRPE